MMVLLAKPVDQAFVLDPAKENEFLNLKADPKIKEMHLKRAERIIRTNTKDENSKIPMFMTL